MNRARFGAFLAGWTLAAACGALHAQTPEGGETVAGEEAPATSPPLIDAPNVQFSGFGTLGAVYTDDSKVRFIRPSTNHPGKENPDFGADSLLGAQANITLGPHSALVLQAVSREDALGSYKPRASLAFLSWAFTPNVTVRAGRVRTPFFMLSETIDINYSNPWIRPPTEVYSMFPFKELDGVDLLVSGSLGGFDVEFHPYFGSSNLSIYQSGRGKLRNVRGANISATRGHLTMFFGHGEADFSLKWKGEDFRLLASNLRRTLFPGGPPLVVNGEDILRDLSGNDGEGDFSVAGVQWDDGKWLFIGEYNKLRANRYAHHAHAWELTAGRRFGDFMPYVMVAGHSEDRPITSQRVQLAVPVPGAAEQLNAGLDSFLASRNLSQKSATLGLRWDFFRNTALKLEFTHARISNRSWGSFYPKELSFDDTSKLDKLMWKRSVNTIGVSVDVTF
jgi:hypothetical protein